MADYKAVEVRWGQRGWAVLHVPTKVFYYGPHYRKAVAEQLAAKLNRADKSLTDKQGK